MKKSWIRLTDELPCDGQEVLAYYYDADFEVDIYTILTYYTAGSRFEFESKMLDNSGLTGHSRLLAAVFDKGREVDQTGLYIYEDGAYRRLADVYTHWQPLDGPDVEVPA